MVQTIQIKRRIPNDFPHIQDDYETIVELLDSEFVSNFLTARGFSADRPCKIERISVHRLRHLLIKESAKETIESRTLGENSRRLSEAIPYIKRDDELFCFYQKKKAVS